MKKLMSGLSNAVIFLFTTVCIFGYGEEVTLRSSDNKLGFDSYAASSFISHLLGTNTVVIASGCHLEKDELGRIQNRDGSVCLLRKAVFHVIKPITNTVTNGLITVVFHEQVNSPTNNVLVPHLVSYPHPCFGFSGMATFETLHDGPIQLAHYCFTGGDTPDPQTVFLYLLILTKTTFPGLSQERVYQYINGAILTENQLYGLGRVRGPLDKP
jgi:hypothetical protein